jgi:hypothetical protein
MSVRIVCVDQFGVWRASLVVGVALLASGTTPALPTQTWAGSSLACHFYFELRYRCSHRRLEPGLDQGQTKL